MDERVNEWIEGLKHELMDGWLDEWTEGWTEETIEGRKDG